MEIPVAPLVGAWIEIIMKSLEKSEQQSLLSWERGLKLINQVTVLSEKSSLLSWERGLK